MPRCFIAIPVTPPALLLDARDSLAGQFSGEKIRWVRNNHMHITIRFIGEINDLLAGGLANSMLKAFSNRQKFSYDLHGLGVFTNRERRPTALWSGIYPEGPFTDIRKILDSVLEEMSLPAANKHFRPHITLSRIKKLSDPESFGDAVRVYGEEVFGSSAAERMVLFESVLTPKGPEYYPLEEVVFAG